MEEINNNNIRDLVVRHRNPDIISRYGHISEWNVSNVTDMNNLFNDTDFNEDISNWDVSNVTNMGFMFCDAHQFNQPLNRWNVSKVTKMSGMFTGAESFNQPLDNWDVSHVKDMSFMFSHAIRFNQPLNDWDVSNVIYMFSTFSNARAFNQPLNKWNVVSVKVMGSMFAGANSFNQPLYAWAKLWKDNNIKPPVMDNMFGINTRMRNTFMPTIENYDYHMTEYKNPSKIVAESGALSNLGVGPLSEVFQFLDRSEYESLKMAKHTHKSANKNKHLPFLNAIKRGKEQMDMAKEDKHHTQKSYSNSNSKIGGKRRRSRRRTQSRGRRTRRRRI